MSKIKIFVNKQIENITGHVGLFLIALISCACEHNVLPEHRTVSEA